VELRVWIHEQQQRLVATRRKSIDAAREALVPGSPNKCDVRTSGDDRCGGVRRIVVPDVDAHRRGALLPCETVEARGDRPLVVPRDDQHRDARHAVAPTCGDGRPNDASPARHAMPTATPAPTTAAVKPPAPAASINSTARAPDAPAAT